MSKIPLEGLDATRATELAQAFAGSNAEVTLCPAKPPGVYQVDGSAKFYFLIDRPNARRVGGSECVSVSKTSGAVEYVGLIGE